MSEPTAGELERRYNDRFADIRDDLQNLQNLIDKRVSVERYQTDQHYGAEADRQLIERIKAIEEARQEEARQADADRRAAEAQRRADKRLLFSALVVPVLLVFLQVYLATRGAGA
ncbi:hypothetical protein ACFU76_04410 [Streptomyces sp. NPDC057539]|uniref:hypothetical protein n=1 Tax=Streptomyces sp. NPDC057539 TaxID=3346159 RepID=UPI003683B58D